MGNLYISATGMIAQNQRLNVLSNNMANVNTNGFKMEEATFKTYHETYMSKKDTDGRERLGSYGNEVFVDDIVTNYSTGAVVADTSTLSLALQDSTDSKDTSFFMVMRDGQEYLTRNGAFQLDADRILSLPNGGMVMNEEGQPITIPQGVDVSISQDGEIINGETFEVIDRIQIRTVAEENLGFIKQEGNGYMSVRNYDELIENYGSIENMISLFETDVTVQKMYKTVEKLEEIRDTGEVDVLEAFTGRTRQNALELSNVQMDEQMVEMINAQKSLQANSKAYQTIDKILELASNGLKKA